MSEIIIISSIVGGISLVVGGWIIGTYNTFINAEQDEKGQFANIKTEYQRRADVFYNLMNIVKGHAKFEKGAFKEITEVRSGNFGGKQTKKQLTDKFNALDNMFGKLMVTFEAYPELQSHKHYDTLMEEVRLTENRINMARVEYNKICEDYNTYINTFPTNILKNVFNRKDLTFYQIGNVDKIKVAPEINVEVN